MAKEGTLLIVDDNRSILAALRLLLEKYFARVLTLPTPNRLATTLREEHKISVKIVKSSLRVHKIYKGVKFFYTLSVVRMKSWEARHTGG